MKKNNKTIDVQGVKVLLVFASESNNAVPPLVIDILKTAYARQHTA